MISGFWALRVLFGCSVEQGKGEGGWKIVIMLFPVFFCFLNLEVDCRYG